MRSVSLGVILAIIALAVLGFLFKGYFDQNAAADAVSEQLTANNATIAQLSAQNQDLESQIAEASDSQTNLQKALNAATESIPARMSANSILHSILDLCSRNNVTGIPLSTMDWTATQIQDQALYVFKMSLKLSGAQADLISYIQALQTQLYPTLAVENAVLSQAPVQVTPDASTDNPSPTPLEIFVPSVDVNIAIYAR
jgi:hypothetical protein